MTFELTPLRFLGIVAVIGTTNIAAVVALRFAAKRNALTLAIFKRIILLAVAITGALWIVLFEFPQAISLLDYLQAVGWFFFAPLSVLHASFWIIEEIRDAQWFNDGFRQGKGGRYAGEAVFRRNEMPSGWRNYSDQKKPEPRIFFGRSKRRFDSRPRNVGTLDDGHVVTVAQSGGGKSVFGLYNNCSTWPGALFQLDPKGELCRHTLAARIALGFHCGVLDPCRVQELRGIDHAHRWRFNPVADIDINDHTAIAKINAIVEGTYIDGGGSDNTYWSESTKMLLAGAIAYCLAALPPETHNLPSIAELFTTGGNKELAALLAAMAKIDVCGGLPLKASSIIRRAGDRQLGILMAELQRSLRWTNDPQMRDQLSHSDFSFQDLIQNTGTTVYVVLPFNQMSETGQIRWMRVLTGLGLLALQTSPKKPDLPVLFSIDEAPALGRFDTLPKAFRELRGSGAKVWLHCQDLATLARLYGTPGWEVFTANATTQVMGIQCSFTADWISRRLGHFMAKQENSTLVSRPLMEPAEVLSYLGKSAGNQLIFPMDGAPWQISSVNYFKSRHSYRKR